MILFYLFALTACKQAAPPSKNIDALYKHLLIYKLDVKNFKDSNGDGEGDFNGLTEKLSYLQSLGINTIWLAPFQPSPLKDNGYNVVDYVGIDPTLDGAAGFKNFMAAAKAKHIKVIKDVILNHTSDQHLWFKVAIADTNSPKHRYVWSD
jgi:maltose alpha-D-glucosyltransferase/alpha-amylase